MISIAILQICKIIAVKLLPDSISGEKLFWGACPQIPFEKHALYTECALYTIYIYIYIYIYAGCRPMLFQPPILKCMCMVILNYISMVMLIINSIAKHGNAHDM